MIKVLDNFLSQEHFNILYEEITSLRFPWYYQEGKVNPNDKLPSLTHSFFEESMIHSNWFNFITPVLEKCDVMALRRIKGNFDYKNHESFKTNLHIDFEKGLDNCKTGIFYVNTNNGGTYFKDGKFVESVANRFVMFPANMEHGTQTHTDVNFRIVLNFVWY
tara:strand:+ start:558 stop:1043 length:486 start_codon:yes stop_codon:yes gene_type:complete